jgi:hypothetical protein
LRDIGEPPFGFTEEDIGVVAGVYEHSWIAFVVEFQKNARYMLA